MIKFIQNKLAQIIARFKKHDADSIALFGSMAKNTNHYAAICRPRALRKRSRTNNVNHMIQNWSKEPYIQGAYSYSFDGNQKDIVSTINEPLFNKVYFAGEALSIKNQAMVHGACESAYSMIATMMKDD